MLVLGISAFYHDSAAALVRDGDIVAAAQEERFTRIKHDPDYPRRAIDACLRTAGLAPSAVDMVAAKIPASTRPTSTGGSSSTAIIGNASSASKEPLSAR